MKKFIFILSFLLISNIFANKTNDSEFAAANKIIDKKVKEYNPSKRKGIKFSEDELDILCGKAHFSSACETLMTSINNKVIKKRTSFVLEKISKESNIDINFLMAMYNKYVKYIISGAEIYGQSIYCSSSICYEKNISDGLADFENALNHLKNNENIKDKYNFKLNDLNDLNDLNINILNTIYLIRYNKNYDYQVLENDFISIHKLWKDYDKYLTEFLKKVNKYDRRWIKLFSTYRHFTLNSEKDYFQSLVTADEHSMILEPLVLFELDNYAKDHQFFTDKNNSEIIHNFEETYIINDNEILSLYSSAPKDFNCHACIPKMSWIHFKKEKNKWKIKNKMINMKTYYGSWGDFVIPEIMRITKEIVLFKSNFHYSGQGFSSEYTKFELFKNGEFKEIFTDTTGYDDSGAFEIIKNDWETKITFRDSNNLIPNLLIEKVGLKDSKNYYEKNLYVFENDKYNLENKP